MSLKQIIKRVIKEQTENVVRLTPEEFKENLAYFNSDVASLKRYYKNKDIIVTGNLDLSYNKEIKNLNVISKIEGKGNLTGKVGKLQFEINGKPFESAVNGDWEYLAELLQRNDLIGKQATVKYFELTEDGIPRFPKVIAIRDFE